MSGDWIKARKRRARPVFGCAELRSVNEWNYRQGILRQSDFIVGGKWARTTHTKKGVRGRWRGEVGWVAGCMG